MNENSLNNRLIIIDAENRSRDDGFPIPEIRGFSDDPKMPSYSLITTLHFLKDKADLNRLKCTQLLT